MSEKLAEAIGQFSWAVVRQDEPAEAAALSQQALRAALDASQLLANAYAEQAIAVRRRARQARRPCWAATWEPRCWTTAAAKQFLATFNMAVVPICWREVEASEGEFSWTVCDTQIQWCRRHGLRVCAGPLVQLDARSLPDWIYLWEDDFDNLLASVREFIHAAVAPLSGQGRSLAMRGPGQHGRDPLALGRREAAIGGRGRSSWSATLDPDAPAVLSLDQPWGEYMGRREVDFPPLHFADALVRAGLELKGLVLEVNLGYGPGCTLPRTPLEFSRQLDYWSLLGLPLYVAMTVPSGDGRRPAGRSGRPAAGREAGRRRAQQAWIARYVPLILAKPAVQGIIWNQLRDGVPHDFPHGGLLDERGQAKPALRTLALIRQTLLK